MAKQYYEFKGSKACLKKIAALLIERDCEFIYDSMTGHLSCLIHPEWGLQITEIIEGVPSCKWDIHTEFPCDWNIATFK